MKTSLLLAGLFLISCLSFGKEVNEITAKAVGQAFLVSHTQSPVLKSTVSMKTAYRAASKSARSMAVHEENTLFYVFNTNSNGFIIVSGDDNVKPILAYSDEGSFDPASIPENVAKWLEGYKKEIRYIVENRIQATPEIKDAWQELLLGTALETRFSAASVSPLLQTQWNQAPYYNALCPFDEEAGELAVTGCVATAMAQIMKYWNYPANGSGFHSYNHANYGTLSANFGTATYDWASMPNTLSGSNSAIATLMYHVGVSVDMNYGPGSTGGSGAYVISAQSPVVNCSEYALKTYFGYKSTLQGIERENYSENQWITLMKTELDANRPVLYAGFGSGGGHCFVADGYDNNEFIHFNWGWGGSYDGYFEINSLNPGGVGIGGGTGGFNSGHQAVIGIEPPEVVQSFNMSLYNYIIPSTNPIGYTDPFTISTNIANFGTGTFSGDFAAAIFDNSYTFLDFVEILSGRSLDAGYAYTNNLEFSNEGLISMLPGTYYVGIFYRPTGGNWVLLKDNNDFVNLIQLQVYYANNIELNSDITITPGTTLIQGEPASVNLNIINDGEATFTGEFGVALYNLEGEGIETIDFISENEGLPQGYTYSSPFLNFNSSYIAAEPGTYLLAAVHKFTEGDWELTGSSYHQNPVKVVVQSSAVQPDVYEDNNAVEEAWNLPVTFTDNLAQSVTTGTTCHTGNDYDFFKIVLPVGYYYSVDARLHDSWNSDDGNTYTLDALFSYSTDGLSWSDSYDDVMENAIGINDGGTVYLMISPYFTGETGNYLMDINISRSPATPVVENETAGLIRVYPNPASEDIWIELKAFTGKVHQIELLNASGQQLLSKVAEPDVTLVKLPVEDLPGGVYYVNLYTDSGLFTRKIVIKN